MMSVTKLKLIVDSHVHSEGERQKLAMLHSLIVREVSAMDIAELVKVTLEFDNSGSRSGGEGAGESAAGAGLSLVPPVQETTGSALTKLSERQREIAFMLCDHYSIKRIAGVIYVSENTVKKHVQNIKKALDIKCSGADFIFTLRQMIAVKRLEETLPQ